MNKKEIYTIPEKDYYLGDYVMRITEYHGLTPCLFQVVKYVLRAGSKPDNPIVEDLKKALWYLRREVSHGVKPIRKNYGAYIIYNASEKHLTFSVPEIFRLFPKLTHNLQMVINIIITYDLNYNHSFQLATDFLEAEILALMTGIKDAKPSQQFAELVEVVYGNNKIGDVDHYIFKCTDKVCGKEFDIKPNDFTGRQVISYVCPKCSMTFGILNPAMMVRMMGKLDE